MSENHEPSDGRDEQDVEAHAVRTDDVEEQAQPAGDDDVQAHIKFN